ncbi:MAG TPA: NADH-quinone oxidoreductase subunit C [Deltaproteobacteria bacterium]|nr:NADH-quinone oxidoreductase subunit C [Deltaproteobacteria bacterium]
MEFQEITQALQSQFEGVVATTDRAGDPFIHVPATKLVEILTFCRDDATLAFDCLSNLTGVDAPPDDLEVVYHLFSYPKRHSYTLKVKVPKAGAHVPTVEGIYPTANWQEREAYDLLGVIFDGHPDLRRIMLPDDWVGHPLRKDYKEQEDYHGMATTRPSLLNS